MDDASRPQAFSPTPLKNLGTLPLLCCIDPSRYNIHQHRRYSSGPAFCCLKPSRCYSHASQWGPTVCVWMPDAITAHGSRKQCTSEHKQIGAACSSQTLQSWDTADEQIARLNHFCLSCVQSSPYLFASHTNFTVKSVTCQIVPSTCGTHKRCGCCDSQLCAADAPDQKWRNSQLISLVVLE